MQQLSPAKANKIHGLLNSAVAAHQQGNLSSARRGYEKVLRIHPSNPDALNLLGTLMFQCGEHQAAIHKIRQAIKSFSGNPQFHYNLGVVYSDCGMLADAIEAYEQAITINPKYYEAYNNLGNLFNTFERYSEAETCFRHAVEINPNDAISLNSLGHMLIHLKRHNEAESYIEQALKYNPNYAEAMTNLGTIKAQNFQWEASTTLFDKAVTLLPDSVAVLNTYAEALFNQMGNPTAAREIYLAALKINPHDYKTLLNLSLLCRALGESENAQKYLEQSMQEHPDYFQAYYEFAQHNPLPPGSKERNTVEQFANDLRLCDERRGAFNLVMGSIYDKEGDVDKAFDYYDMGNALIHKTQNLNIKETKAFTDTIEKNFSAELFNKLESSLPVSSNPTPIFIVGMARSGSSLTEQILSSHPDIGGVGEITLLYNMINEFSISPDIVDELQADTLKEAADYYRNKLQAYSPGSRYIVDKQLENFFHIGVIQILFPQAPIIHCHRNPRDMCVSSYSISFNSNPAAYSLEDLGQSYYHYRHLMRHWNKALPNRILTINYEEMVAEPEAVSRRIIDYIGLPWDERCLSFHKQKTVVRTASIDQVRRPIFKDAVEKWCRVEHRLGPLMSWIEKTEQEFGQLYAYGKSETGG
jgi:tetratricopeptide (TPR) repeat protein